MPASYGYIGTRYVYTYNNTHATDIRANGFVIDSLGDGSNFYIDNYVSWNVDSELTVQ